MEQVNKNQGKVYVLMNENSLVKIGTSANPNERKSRIETMSGYEVVNIYQSELCWNPYRIEAAAHKYFSNHRKQGEWFSVDFNDAVDIVKQLYEISAIVERKKPDSLDAFEIFQEMLNRSLGFRLTSDGAKSIDGMQSALSDFFGEKIDIDFFNSEIDSYIELDEKEDVKSLASNYLNLSKGIFNSNEWGKYISNTYSNLKHSNLCPFVG